MSSQPKRPKDFCKTCWEEGQRRQRPAPHPGPRCTTHHRAEVKRRKATAHDARVQKVYGLAEGDYEALYVFQGGRCPLCQRATGTGRRKLAVDHDHRTGQVRGLLCSIDNQLLGHARDDRDFFLRCIAYLDSPPAIAFLKRPAQEED